MFEAHYIAQRVIGVTVTRDTSPNHSIMRVLAIGTLHSTIYVLRTLIDYVVLYDPSMRVQYALGFRKFRVYAVLVLIGSVGIGVLVDDAAQGFRV